jgi:hypothetical protein
LTALDIAASGRGPQLVLREPVWAVDVLRTPVPFLGQRVYATPDGSENASS